MPPKRSAERPSRAPWSGPLLAAALLVLAGCSAAAPDPPASGPGAGVSAGGSTPATGTWVNDTLARLTLAEKAAQLVMVRVHGLHLHPESDAYRDLAAAVGELGVGGVVAFDSDLDSLPLLLDRLQTEADLPLLVAADFERGAAFRVARGTTDLPSAMALGATGSPALAEAAGRLSAHEARVLGVHWLLAPVADLNVDPANPIIGTRAFGEDPARVARAVAAFVRGARAGGALATVKHFPGHGDTAVDSHQDLPVLAHDRERLERVELAPFRAAIDAGVEAVMLGHLAVPALDPSGAPASLSPAIATGLLREAMGFDGLIATDALEMDGLDRLWPGARAVAAVEAGADVLLLPDDARLAVDALVRAVGEGQIDETRLDASVRRVLATKAALGLDRRRRVGRPAVRAAVGSPRNATLAQAIAEASVTVVRNGGGTLPLPVEEPLDPLLVTLTSGQRRPRADLERELRARRLPVTHLTSGPDVATATADRVLTAAAGASHVVVAADVSVRDGLSASQVTLLERLRDTGGRERAPPVTVIALDSPYLLAAAPWIEVFVATYGTAAPSLEAAVRVLLGEIPSRGTLPVSLADDARAGHGVALPARALTLRDEPAAAGTFAEVDDLLDGFVARRAFPGGVLAVGHRGALVHLRPFGRLAYRPDAAAVTADTIYDLASLTKVIVTATVAMMLVDDERIALEMPLRQFLPGFSGPDKDAVTLHHLLAHSAGLPTGAPLYRELRGREAYRERIEGMDLVYPPGTEARYSDLGPILLGAALERAAGRSIDRFADQRIFAPLGMTDTGFVPTAEVGHRIAPTEDDPWRGRVLRGEVHDENAHALGGVAPHAGLFGTAPDLARFAQMMLWGGVYAHRRLIDRATIERFTRAAGVPGSTRALGWDTKSPKGSSAGSFFSPASYGHTGFTGTSLWIDPLQKLFVILLTNRVHPSRDTSLIREARPAVADAVARALGLATATDPVTDRAAASREPVRTGLDRIDAGETEALRGKRIGLLIHAASRTARGKHALVVFREQGLQVVRLFAPEHGLLSRFAAGRTFAGGPLRDGGDLVSLYGEKRQPTAEDLAGLDVLVIDLQDAGVRFYTYVSTLILCLEAAAAHGVPVVVLDRPNPLGGERVEGPVSAPRDVVPASFVNLAPGPLVHGLTLGEMAHLVNARLDPPARLEVIAMRGWRRAMTWLDTGLPWVAPSPNLRSPLAALAYPGVALLEATNINEGRGSPHPFLHIGAPWLKPEPAQALLRTVTAPGFSLETTSFTAERSPAAPSPKYDGMACHGLRIRAADLRTAEPYRLGVSLLSTLSEHPGFQLLDQGRALVRLTGTTALLDALDAGHSIDEIVALDAAQHAAWRRQRRPFLLYR